MHGRRQRTACCSRPCAASALQPLHLCVACRVVLELRAPTPALIAAVLLPACARARPGLSLVEAGTIVPADTQHTTPITGYPEGAWLNYVSWSPDGRHITFTTRSPGAAGWRVCARVFRLQPWTPRRRKALKDACMASCLRCRPRAGGPGNPPRGPLQLWIADAKTGRARPLLGSCRLNTVFDSYTWCVLRAGACCGARARCRVRCTSERHRFVAVAVQCWRRRHVWPHRGCLQG
jgi:hypothetical protein